MTVHDSRFVLQIVLSAYMSVTAVSEMLRNNYKFWGTGFNPSEKGMAFVIWLFYVSKYVEFGDTLIMVAKGNTRQISFLHVYHHVTISLIW
jgi:elongation of very long chain fatty acids protein 4